MFGDAGVVFAVGQGYRNFTQTSDDEVVAVSGSCLTATAEAGAIDAAADPLASREVQVAAGPVPRAGQSDRPRKPRGIVVFATWLRGSSRQFQYPQSVRCRGLTVGPGLRRCYSDFAHARRRTHRANVFDIEPLASRLIDDRLVGHPA